MLWSFLGSTCETRLRVNIFQNDEFYQYCVHSTRVYVRVCARACSWVSECVCVCVRARMRKYAWEENPTVQKEKKTGREKKKTLWIMFLYKNTHSRESLDIVIDTYIVPNSQEKQIYKAKKPEKKK